MQTSTVIKNIPVIGLALSLLGFVRLYGYYTYFGIDITPYVGLTEIIKTTFAPLAFLMGTVLLALGSIMIVIHGRNSEYFHPPSPDTAPAASNAPVDNTSQAQNPNPNKGSAVRTKQQKSLAKAILILCIILVGNACIGTVHFSLEPDSSLLLLTGYTAASVFSVFGSYFFVAWDKESGPFGFRSIIYGASLCAVLQVVFFVGVVGAHLVSNDRDDFSLRYHDNIYSSKNQLQFVGQTENYIFIYDYKLKNALVLKSESVDSLVFNARPRKWVGSVNSSKEQHIVGRVGRTIGGIASKAFSPVPASPE